MRLKNYSIKFNVLVKQYSIDKVQQKLKTKQKQGFILFDYEKLFIFT